MPSKVIITTEKQREIENKYRHLILCIKIYCLYAIPTGTQRVSVLILRSGIDFDSSFLYGMLTNRMENFNYSRSMWSVCVPTRKTYQKNTQPKVWIIMLMCVCTVRCRCWLVVNKLCDVDKPYRTISRFSAACMILSFFFHACISHAGRLTMTTSKAKKTSSEGMSIMHCGRRIRRKVDACENWKEQLEPFSTRTDHKHIKISCIASIPIDPNLCGRRLARCDRRVFTSFQSQQTFHISHYASLRTERLRCCSQSHSHYSSSS